MPGLGQNFHIRPARPDDVDVILQLIIDLAVYAKEPDAVKATPELLREYLFETPIAQAILAFRGDSEGSGEAIGLALYFFNYSTWTGRPGIFLDDLYVKPDHRRKGVGSALFGQLGQIAQEKNCARIDWDVLKWNDPSIKFYKENVGAKALSEWMRMRLEENSFKNLEKLAARLTKP